ncbi:MAG TPA: hypothetical protein VIT63_02505, partial [Nitrospira sp.]
LPVIISNNTGASPSHIAIRLAVMIKSECLHAVLVQNDRHIDDRSIVDDFFLHSPQHLTELVSDTCDVFR